MWIKGTSSFVMFFTLIKHNDDFFTFIINILSHHSQLVISFEIRKVCCGGKFFKEFYFRNVNADDLKYIVISQISASSIRAFLLWLIQLETREVNAVNCERDGTKETNQQQNASAPLLLMHFIIFTWFAWIR